MIKLSCKTYIFSRYTIYQCISYCKNMIYFVNRGDITCNLYNCIGIMVSVLALSAVYRLFEPRSSQTRYYFICICCFFAKHVTFRSKSKDWLDRTQNNVSDCSDISICWLLFQWAITLKILLNRVGLVQSWPHHHLIEKETCSRYHIAENVLIWR